MWSTLEPLRRSEESYPELKVTNNAICKSIWYIWYRRVEYVQSNSKAFKFVSIGHNHNHNHSNMDDSLCLVMIIEIWMTFMLRITVIEIWVISSHSHSNMGDLVSYSHRNMGNLYMLNYKCTYSNHEKWRLQDYGLLDYMDSVKTNTEEIEDYWIISFWRPWLCVVLRSFVNRSIYSVNCTINGPCTIWLLFLFLNLLSIMAKKGEKR